MFNKIIQGLKSDSKKREEEQRIRLDAISNELKEIFKLRNVNHYEALDLLHGMVGELNFMVASIMIKNHNEINKLKQETNELNLKLETYELDDQSKKGAGEEVKQ
jgi:hypothetical protein